MSHYLHHQEHHVASDLIGHVLLGPHQHQTLALGTFESGMDPPLYCLEYKPRDAGDYVGAVLLRKPERPDDGEYTLFYIFDNFGMESCTVAVRTCELTGQEHGAGECEG